MASVASGGTADRIAARIRFKVLRAGSGTPARYSSMSFGGGLLFAGIRFQVYSSGIRLIPMARGNPQTQDMRIRILALGLAWTASLCGQHHRFSWQEACFKNPRAPYCSGHEYAVKP